MRAPGRGSAAVWTPRDQLVLSLYRGVGVPKPERNSRRQRKASHALLLLLSFCCMESSELLPWPGWLAGWQDYNRLLLSAFHVPTRARRGACVRFSGHRMHADGLSWAKHQFTQYCAVGGRLSLFLPRMIERPRSETPGKEIVQMKKKMLRYIYGVSSIL